MKIKSSKGIMILLLVFLLFTTSFSILELDYQIGIPEHRIITHIPAHDSTDPNDKMTYIDMPIVKECKAILVGVIIVLIGFIVYAICCIRRKLYGRMEVVSFALSLVYWTLGVFVSRM